MEKLNESDSFLVIGQARVQAQVFYYISKLEPDLIKHLLQPQFLRNKEAKVELTLNRFFSGSDAIE